MAPSFMSRSILLAILLIYSSFSLAVDGFDDTYDAFSGDLNGDGATDLYVRSKSSPFVPIVVDDLSVVVPIKALPKELVLHGKTAQNPAWIKLQLTPADRSAVAAWPKAAGVKLRQQDFNADGSDDLAITGPSFRELIFASTRKGSHSPIGHNSLSDDEQLFLKTVGDWMINPSSLERNRYKVVGVQPPTAIWKGYFSSSVPSPQTVSFALSTFCEPNRDCGLSNVPPTGSCIRTTNNYDVNGNFLGVFQTDVCQFPLHVYSYIPGTVTLSSNAAYHQNAVAFIDAYEDVLNGSVTSYAQLTSTVSLLGAYLGASSPIGSSNQECEDAPILRETVVGIGPLAIPVLACAAAAVLVVGAILTRTHDIVDILNETTVYSNGRATGPMPHGHRREEDALDFKPNPFGDDCDPPPPNRTGKIRENYQVLKDTGAWRRTDINPNDRIGYPGHRQRILRGDKQREKLKKSYRDICGGEIE